jgi:xylose isomerase
MVYIILIISFGLNYVLWFQREEYAAQALQYKEKEAKTFHRYMEMYTEYLKLKKEMEEK